MKLLDDDLVVNVERWDDPGDYPSGAGSGPLPSHDYVEAVEGTVTIELEAADFNLGPEWDGKLTELDIRGWVADADPSLVEYDVPHGIRVKKWKVLKIDGMKVTLVVEEFEAGEIERGGNPELDCPDD